MSWRNSLFFETQVVRVHPDQSRSGQAGRPHANGLGGLRNTLPGPASSAIELSEEISRVQEIII
jgi:hypothetical protein